MAPRAHLVELDIAWHDPRENHARALRLLDREGTSPGDLAVLPEMFATGFSFETALTIDRDGTTLAFVRKVARDRGIWVAAGRSIASGNAGAPGESPRALNVLTVAGPDGAVACEYTKVHPFTIGGEAERFDSGRAPAMFDWGDGGLRVCPTICYDLRFPELYRLGVLGGAEAFIVAANWPDARQAHWRALLIARAIENQAFVLGVNRCGSDPRLRYAGGSIAISPRGEVLGELPASDAPNGPDGRILSVEISPEEARTWRRKFPALQDIRLLDRAMGRHPPR